MLRLPLALLSLVAMGLAGCGMPVSRHPLSDETNSRVDEALLGHWELHAIGGKMPEPDEPAPRYLFARREGQPNVMEMAAPQLNDGFARLERSPMHACEVGGERYLSMPLHCEEGAEQSWQILRYEHKEGRVLMYLLDGGPIVQAIENGELAGTVEREETPPDGEQPATKPAYKSVVITAEPETLRAFVERRGKELFVAEPVYEFRKVNE